jgi:hypothetical protein
MGFFSDVVSGIFGGTDTSAQDAAIGQNAAAAAAIRAATQQARNDALGLFPQGQQARSLGFQGALDVLGQTIPQQLQAFQAGNVGAQQNLAAGLPQFQNAILGGQVDFSAFQPTRIPIDTGFASQQLPNFGVDLGPRGSFPANPDQTTPTLGPVLGGGGAVGGQGGRGVVAQGATTGGGSLSNPFAQPQQTSAFGVTEINPIVQLLAGLVPGGSLATGGVRLNNLSNIRDVQGVLGLDETSLLNAINPFSRLASGASDASLGRGTFGRTNADVTFGGLTEGGRTALTPKEALDRLQGGAIARAAQDRIASAERFREADAREREEQRSSGRSGFGGARF